MSNDVLSEWGAIRFSPEGMEASVSAPAGDSTVPETTTLAGTPEECLAAWKEQVPSARKLALALRASEVMFMILELPTRDAEELDAMLEIQVEELSPFPPERTRMGWEILGQLEGGASRVLVVITSLQKLEGLHELLVDTTGIPERIDVDVLGVIHRLKAHSAFEPGEDSWNVLLLDDSAHLVAWHEATPVLIRSMGSRDELDEEMVLEELQQARLPVETAFPGTSDAQLHLWVTGELPAWAEAEGVQPHLQIHVLEEPCSSTAGVVERSGLTGSLNLIPVRWRQEAEARQRRRKVLKTAGVVLAVWALLLGGLSGWTFYRSWELDKLERLNDEQTAAMGEIRVLSDQVRSLSQFTDRSQSALELLRILAEAAPPSSTLELEEFRYRKQRDHVFTGTFGQRVEPFNRFLEMLEGNELLTVEDWSTKQTRTGNEFRFETNWRWEEGP